MSRFLGLSSRRRYRLAPWSAYYWSSRYSYGLRAIHMTFLATSISVVPTVVETLLKSPGFGLRKTPSGKPKSSARMDRISAHSQYARLV